MMNEKHVSTKAVALDSNEYFPPFEFQNGSIFLYASIEPKTLSPYQYWGRLKLMDGQLKYVRLWAFSGLQNVVYYKGYALDTLEALHTVYNSPHCKDTGFFILFNNPDPGTYEYGILRPSLTGKLYLEPDTLLVNLSEQEGIKGIYYSGTLDTFKPDQHLKQRVNFHNLS